MIKYPFSEFPGMLRTGSKFFFKHKNLEINTAKIFSQPNCHAISDNNLKILYNKSTMSQHRIYFF